MSEATVPVEDRMAIAAHKNITEMGRKLLDDPSVTSEMKELIRQEMKNSNLCMDAFGLQGATERSGSADEDEESIQRVLLVGGEDDGEWINVVRKVSRSVCPTKDGKHYEAYNRIAGHPVFLISTESPDNLIPFLIEGYRRKE